MIQQAMQMFNNNPMFQRAKNMVQGKSEEEIKQTAINLCKQRGIDMDSAYNVFKEQFGGFLGIK